MLKHRGQKYRRKTIQSQQYESQVPRCKQVVLIVDKLSDSEGRFVLDVMAVFLDFEELFPGGNSVAWLLDSHFLSKTNTTEQCHRQ